MVSLDGCLPSRQALHALGIIQKHPILEIQNIRRRGQQFALLNIGIAVGKSVLHLHAAANGGARYQRHSNDKGVFLLPELLLCQHTAPNGGRAADPFLERRRIAPCATMLQQRLLLRERVMKTLCLIHPCGQLLRRLLPALVSKQPFLLCVIYGDVLQGQCFSIHDMVHRAQHLQNAFKGHPYDAFHACDKILCIICGYICPESQFPRS